MYACILLSITDINLVDTMQGIFVRNFCLALLRQFMRLFGKVNNINTHFIVNSNAYVL